jgi:DNA repair exonuclease SbcCD ATPase subunit
LKWLKNIFPGSKVRGEALSLPLLDINSWLEDRQRDSGFEECLSEIYNRLDGVAKGLSGDVSALISAEPDPSTPPKLLRAGLAARGELVKQMESMNEKLMPPKRRDIESASQHHWALVKGLERTVTTFGRAQQFVGAVFPKCLESINSDLTELSRLLVDLESEVAKRRKLHEEIWYSRELVARLQEELSGIDNLRRKTIENEESLTRTRSQFSTMEEDLKRLAASQEGRKAEEEKKILEKKKEDLSRTEDELRDLVAPLTKALSRIMKQGSSERLNLQHKDIFQQLLSSPSQVSDKDIAGSLSELRAHLASLGLKDRKKEKVLDHIDLLIKKKSLEDARSRHLALEKEIKDLRELLDESGRQAVHLKDLMASGRKSIRSLEAALDQSHKDQTSLEEKARLDESELKKRLTRLAGMQIDIDLPQGKG